jgi:hypothetical protein
MSRCSSAGLHAVLFLFEGLTFAPPAARFMK